MNNGFNSITLRVINWSNIITHEKITQLSMLLGSNLQSSYNQVTSVTKLILQYKIKAEQQNRWWLYFDNNKLNKTVI